MKRWSAHIGIVIFWCVAIILFLYSGSLTHLFDRGKNINVLVWGQVLDKEFLSDFENETGIHINMSYFENNEELFVKLQSSDQHDYDLIMPSDWAAQLLIQKGLIKKLDRRRIDAWDNLYPALCNHYFDPHNDYTIPFYWSLFGIGIDTRYFGGKVPAATWGLIFDERIMPERIATVEDPRALILTAALYLFGPLALLGKDEVKKIKQLLIKQKSRVEIYTDSRVEYVLASGVVPVVVGLLGDFLKVMRRFDYIDFVIPQEGGFAIIDSFALTATTKKDDLVYQFLHYLFRPDIVKKYVDKFDFFPAVKIKIEYDNRFAQYAEPTKALFKNINFFRNVVSKDILNDVLITLKS
jgi:spermidine/putrescine-binding protein